MNIHSLGRIFFYQVHAISRGKGKNQFPQIWTLSISTQRLRLPKLGGIFWLFKMEFSYLPLFLNIPFILTTFKFTLINFAKCQESILISLTNSHYSFQTSANFASTLTFFFSRVQVKIKNNCVKKSNI